MAPRNQSARRAAARDDHVVADLSVDHARRVPIDRDVANELERRLLVVVLRKIGRHLQRRVEHDIERELLGQRRARPRLFQPARPSRSLLEQEVEDPGREIHRAGEHAREEENRLVLRRIAAVPAPRVVLLPARALAGHHVRIRPALAGVVHRLVRVHHDAVVRRRLDHLAVVVHHVLAIVRMPPPAVSVT